MHPHGAVPQLDVGRMFASSDRRALLASLGLHALIVLLVVAFVRREFGQGDLPHPDVPAIQIVHALVLERFVVAAHPTPVKAPPKAATLPQAYALPKGPAVLSARVVERPLAGTPTIAATMKSAHRTPTAPHVVVAEAPLAPAVENQALTATPPPTPAPPPAAGGFAQNHPAIFWDAHAFDDLRTQLGSFSIVVEVDESGRALRVEFVQPLADPARRDEVVARLLAAHYLPAQCDGLDCPGEVTFHS